MSPDVEHLWDAMSTSWPTTIGPKMPRTSNKKHGNLCPGHLSSPYRTWPYPVKSRRLANHGVSTGAVSAASGFRAPLPAACWWSWWTWLLKSPGDGETQGNFLHHFGESPLFYEAFVNWSHIRNGIPCLKCLRTHGFRVHSSHPHAWDSYTRLDYTYIYVYTYIYIYIIFICVY